MEAIAAAMLSGGCSARYLGEILDEAVATGRTEVIAATALGAKRRNGGWAVELDDGTTVESRALVLAVGNQEPGPLSAFAGIGDQFVSDPWGSTARKAVEDLAASDEPTSCSSAPVLP